MNPWLVECPVLYDSRPDVVNPRTTLIRGIQEGHGIDDNLLSRQNQCGAMNRLFTLFILAVPGLVIFAIEPAADISAINDIPDLVQTDPEGRFARGGKSYCGPVAASNSLVWLQNGSNGPFTDRRAQHRVVNRLASPGYMNADPVSGVGAVKLIQGVRRFVREDLGDDDFSLAYQGWRSAPKEHFEGIREPRLEWIRSHIGPAKSAWINLGWYRHDKAADAYERIGGHWVTAVGYGVNEDGTPNPGVIVIHDPSPRTGKEPNDYVLLTKLQSGTLIGDSSRLPRPAKGLYRMGGGMHIKSTADVAILDGVVGLNLEVDETESR